MAAQERPPAYVFEAEFEPDRGRCLEAVLVVLRSPIGERPEDQEDEARRIAAEKGTPG